MLSFSVKEPKHLANRGLKSGSIIGKGIGPIANSLRRILLDEIPRFAIDEDTAIMRTDDPNITYDLLRVISLVAIPQEEAEFFINIKVEGEEPYKILSNHIMDAKTHKPAKVEQDVELCTLAPDCFLKVIGLKTKIGTGRQHVKFSAVTGTITYKPVDICFITYLNDRGFIETNLRPVRIKDIVGYKPETRYIYWTEEWSKKCSVTDLKYSERFTKIKMVENFKFLSSSEDNAEDFEVNFKCPDPEKLYKISVDILRDEINKKVTFNDFFTIKEPYSISAGEVIRYFCVLETDCKIFGNWNSEKNEYRLTISHDDHDQILANAIKKINNILKV